MGWEAGAHTFQPRYFESFRASGHSITWPAISTLAGAYYCTTGPGTGAGSIKPASAWLELADPPPSIHPLYGCNDSHYWQEVTIVPWRQVFPKLLP